MAQFDLYPQRGAPGFWVDCQTDLLEHIDTRFVVPLIPREGAPEPIRRLNPVFGIGGIDFILLTQQAGPIPIDQLERSAGSLAGSRYDILNALDFLITGV
jgi:toxin CcdB